MKFNPTFFLRLSKLCILLSFHAVFSQTTIKGKVISSDKKLIPYATIFILDSSKEKVLKNSNSDDNGLFEIFLDSSNTMNAKYVYARYLKSQSDTFLISNADLLIVVNNTIDLSEVVVRGNKPSLVREADRFIYTPSNSLKEGTTTLDVIKLTPLINYDTKTDLFSIINKENTTIIINNRRSVLPKDMLISFLRSTPAKNIINIEIITNPGSEYSANTTGGVININLKKNIDEGLSGNLVITSEQAVLNTSILNGTVNYRKGKVGIRISPFINNSFNYRTYENEIEAINRRWEETDGKYKRRYLVLGGGFGLDYDINDKNLLSINGFASTVNGTSNQSNMTLYSSDAKSKVDSVYSSPISGKDNYLYNFGNIFFEHKMDMQGRKKLTLNIDYNQFKKKNTDIGSFLNESITGRDSVSLYKNVFPQEFFNISESIDYSTQVNERSKINIGGQISTTGFKSDLSYSDFNFTKSIYEQNSKLSNKYEYLENYLAVYASQSIKINDKVDVNFGLRLERTKYYSENKTQELRIDSIYLNLFPNLSISYAINKNKTLSLSLAKKIKRPSFELLLPGRSYYNPNYFSENNHFLQPVNTYNADMMYALNNKYFFSTGYSYSFNQYNQFIIADARDGSIKQKKTYINYGNSSNTYLQLYTKQSLFNNFWEINLSTTLNYSNYLDKVGYLAERSLDNFNYNLSLNNVLYLSKEKKMLAFVIFRYYSPIKDIFYERENVLFKNDIGFRKAFQNLNLMLYLSDIFNSYAVSRTIYQSNQVQLSNKLIQNNYTRSVSLSLNYNFGNNKLKIVRNKRSANEEIKNRIN